MRIFFFHNICRFYLEFIYNRLIGALGSAGHEAEIVFKPKFCCKGL